MALRGDSGGFGCGGGMVCGAVAGGGSGGVLVNRGRGGWGDGAKTILARLAPQSLEWWELQAGCEPHTPR
jgi:hypothetical protein